MGTWVRSDMWKLLLSCCFGESKPIYIYHIVYLELQLRCLLVWLFVGSKSCLVPDQWYCIIKRKELLSERRKKIFSTKIVHQSIKSSYRSPKKEKYFENNSPSAVSRASFSTLLIHIKVVRLDPVLRKNLIMESTFENFFLAI